MSSFGAETGGFVAACADGNTDGLVVGEGVDCTDGFVGVIGAWKETSFLGWLEQAPQQSRIAMIDAIAKLLKRTVFVFIAYPRIDK